MLDLADYLTESTPLPLIAAVVIYNLVLKAINLHHERSKAREEAEQNERILKLASELASALKEIEYLKEDLRQERDRK